MKRAQLAIPELLSLLSTSNGYTHEYPFFRLNNDIGYRKTRERKSGTDNQI